MGPGICLTGMDCSLIQELARKELTMRLLCNASNQLAILSRIAIVIQFILIVSIVASIGITWLWVNCAVVLGWCHAVLINCPGIDRLLIELTNRNGLHKDWWIVQGFMGMFRNRATLLQSSGLWKIASDLGIDSKSSCIVSGLQKNGTIHNTGRTFGEMVADCSWIQEWACNPHNFMQCFQSTCNPVQTCDPDAIRVECARISGGSRDCLWNLRNGHRLCWELGSCLKICTVQDPGLRTDWNRGATVWIVRGLVGMLWHCVTLPQSSGNCDRLQRPGICRMAMDCGGFGNCICIVSGLQKFWNWGATVQSPCNLL